ncbi:hypothetical protein LZ30DRAFT_300725 [Colletotrichum cereale]|nr:hypothetical protein LZ30DRAFT_300725 [Colletotrichum cereale]
MPPRRGRGGMASVHPVRPISSIFEVLWYQIQVLTALAGCGWDWLLEARLRSSLLLLLALPLPDSACCCSFLSSPPQRKNKKNNKVTPDSQTSRSCFSEQANSERALGCFEYRYASLHPDLACHACTLTGSPLAYPCMIGRTGPLPRLIRPPRPLECAESPIHRTRPLLNRGCSPLLWAGCRRRPTYPPPCTLPSTYRTVVLIAVVLSANAEGGEQGR